MPVTDDVKFAELMHSARHYSNLRFAMLTIFLAISGALLSRVIGDTPQPTVWIDVVRWAGVLSALVFLVLEIVLNVYLARTWGLATQYDSQLAHLRSTCIRYATRAATIAPSLLLLIFWLALPSLRT